MQQNPKNPPPKQPNRKLKFSLGYLLVGVAAIMVFNLFSSPPPAKLIPYSELKERIANKEFERIWLTDRYVVGVFPKALEPDTVPSTEERKGLSGLFDQGNRVSALRIPDDKSLFDLMDESGIQYEVKYENTALRDFLMTWILPFALLIFLWTFIFKRMGPGTEVMTFGKNRARVQAESDLKTSFKDVAGTAEAKEELREVIEFLQTPKRFTALGGKLPKGILLVGPPGTGKTLLARAVAGEASVPFFNISGSDFVEMFVGVGAARVRDLFKQAKSKAPCIIFVDELDAVGKARGVNVMGGHDEREQTLNALLVEMDGFDSQVGVIIMAATNRPEILDPALLRAGRFDRHVMVGRPDLKERRAILELHAKGVKKDKAVELQTIAQSTPGLVGADLANVVNEAALLAARHDKQKVEMKDFEAAVDRILTGLEKKNRVINKKEKEIVAHHEAGHAVVAALCNEIDKVHKISIIPRGIGALGFTLQLPTEDRYLMTQNELIDKVDVLLGGRAAESIIFSDVSTGAQDDLQRATDIVRSMITRYGMGQTLGPTTVDQERTPIMMNRGELSSGKNFSEATAREIDEEIRNMMNERLGTVIQLLKKNIALLKEVANELLEKEALNEKEFMTIVRRYQKNESGSVA